MKTIGLLGGMSWESTVPYYRQINEAVKARLGGLHSAKIVLYSVDFAEIERLQHRGDWAAAGALLADAARALERAGADFIVLCTNTMHKVAPAVEAAVKIPLLHIADPTAAAIHHAGLHRVGLQALLALDDGEADPLAFLQALETLHLDGAEVDEHVLAIFTADESESLGIVEPLDGAGLAL